MNINNSNPPFQDFSKCDYNLHWSYSNFIRHINVIHTLSSDSKIIELGAGDSMYKTYAENNFNKPLDIVRYDINSEYDDIEILDLAEGLKEKDEEVDIVIFTEVIEHLDNPSFIMDEIKRVLKPGGQLIISTPTPNDEQLIYPSDHDMEFSYKEIVKLINKNFRIDREFPWAITEYTMYNQINRDPVLQGVYTRLTGNLPDGMIRAILGMLVVPELAKQVTFTCTKVKGS